MRREMVFLFMVRLVGVVGLEPTTSRSQSAHSKPTELHPVVVSYYTIDRTVMIKRRNAAIVVVILLVLFIAIGYIVRTITNLNEETIEYRLEGKTYTLLSSNTPVEWERGLMNIRKLPDADGMIFLFPFKEPRSFWNSNTYLDLDVYWIENDEVVGKTHLPSIQKSGQVVVIKSPKPVNKVIELVR